MISAKKNQYQFAIAGCGRIAQRHAECIAGCGVLTAVCDIKKENAENLAKRYNAKPYFDINELLSQKTVADVICICTPNGLHAEQSILALRSGFNVLCEKPMALTSTDCKAMIDSAKQFSKKLIIVKQNRFNPPVTAVKKIIDEGRLGKIFNVQLNCFWNRDKEYYKNSWKGSKQSDGGTLFTQLDRKSVV